MIVEFRLNMCWYCRNCKKKTVTINVDEQKKGGDIKQFQIDEQSN